MLTVPPQHPGAVWFSQFKFKGLHEALPLGKSWKVMNVPSQVAVNCIPLAPAVGPMQSKLPVMLLPLKIVEPAHVLTPSQMRGTVAPLMLSQPEMLVMNMWIVAGIVGQHWANAPETELKAFSEVECEDEDMDEGNPFTQQVVA